MGDSHYTKWILDVTQEPPVFSPFGSDTGIVIYGIAYVGDKCPGELVGIYHHAGEEAREAWVAANPDWFEKFK
jgi:hypothetical protein